MPKKRKLKFKIKLQPDPPPGETPQYILSLDGGNGEIVLSSELHPRRASCFTIAERILKEAKAGNIEIVDETRAQG